MKTKMALLHQWLLSPYVVALMVGALIGLGASTAVLAKEKRHRVIEFDDELVEGMNKRPLDSLSEISERERHRARPHLYLKRIGFRQETQQTLREMRYSL